MPKWFRRGSGARVGTGTSRVAGRADRRGGTFGPDGRGVVTVIVVREVVDMAFLVAYASKHGATGGVAGRVAATRVRN